ncbi:MAG: ATP-binding cassette domain-containing protein [Nostoc sp.]
MNVIELQNVNYVRPGMNHPLQDIQLTVRKGELVYLKGESGEGKSTLIDFILGIREPDSGEVTVFGYPPGDLKSRFLTGVVLQKLNSPIRNAQLGSLIDLIESHYPEAQGRVTSIFKDFEFHPLRDKNKKYLLAGGEERLLFIALAQAGSPKLLILDEPTTFLHAQDTEDKKARRTIFRDQIKNFVERGNTVLLVSQDPDADTFFQPTRSLLLKNGRINEATENNVSSPETSGTDELDLIDFNKVDISHWIYLLFKHVCFNIQQTFQSDQKYILLTFIASFLWAICISFASKMGSSEDSSNLYTIANAYSFYLAMTAANSTGNIIAEERQNEILIKLLKILPLPPIIYLSAKVIASLLITSLLVLTMLVTTLICNVLSPSIFPLLSMGLILGSIPYLFLGLALGYLLEKPKSIQIAALMCSLTLAIPIFARPMLKAIESVFAIPGKLDIAELIGDNIAAHSPIYHYIQLILCLGKAPEYDQYHLLHFIWLVWFTFISSIIALWAYWRTIKKEAKA